jgi:hypothetical protein
MTLWGNIDYDTGNNKPKYANTATTLGISNTELTRANGTNASGFHAGWVSVVKGTGPIASVIILNPGVGMNSSGYLQITGGGGANANIYFQIGNTRNTLQSFSTNSSWNVVTSVTVTGGDSFNAAPTLTYVGPIATTNATFQAVMGGRVGRIQTETLVAMGSIIGDDSKDDYLYPGT